MVSEGMYIESDSSPSVEISVPIFLKPVLLEILSIGKSIKVLRFLEARNKAT